MIEATGLGRRFGAFTAVEDISLRAPDGTVVALLGPNGAGKTTTVRMLAGLIAPTTGEAQVAGYDVRRDPAEVRARVGMVTDTPGLYEQMTLPAYLDFFGGVYGMPLAERRKRIAELTHFFDLDAHGKERMVGFSKGMKQKVALARALLHEPAALFLDEPTSGLDPLAARAVRDLILSLKHSSRSIILCTHDLGEAERLADEVIMLRRGRVVAADTPAALRAQASPDTTVRVELARPCAEAVARLRQIERLSNAREVADADERVTLVYTTPQPASVNPLAIASLVAAGAEIIAVTCETRTLEDVYAHVFAQTEDADLASAQRA